MSTKTQYFCDKCGAENTYQYPRYSLQARRLYDTIAAFCSNEMELCGTCQESLVDTLRQFGFSVYGQKRDTIK